ncbi:TonB-dependent receptor [Cellulophaga sp. F20128]|uniref:TonB-dependent receptor n=1 Tax=Cellulophaga sp. F20128 TaxID=2926413 RepID=UPI001FF31767|nr:TonB-dependent receptor [Cellulophaga sp. F20128]MCK0158006.1 TonB-dependent receptor [Cellulophaga sp. F20128]
MRLFLLTFCLLTCLFSKAQETGSIVGKLTDKEMNNDPLAFANVLIKGTTKGTTSDFDGLYEIANLVPGNYTVQYSYVGYETIEIPNVEIISGKVTTINVPMAANEGMQLDEIVITTVSRKDSETALLLDQKKAVEMKTSIGAQELARKGVSDVATAVTKTTGISKQEGSGNVFVRGLGDRYNVTTMNGLPLPSNNPSNKNIDLEIFSTDIVEYIGIDKTYSTKNYGDFAGANIDIASKNYTGSGFIELGVGVGGNSEAIGVSTFYLNDGPNFSGFYSKDYPAFPLNNYNFSTSWDREVGPTPINSSISLKGGDSFNLGEDSRLSFFAVGSFDNDYSYKEGIVRGGVNVSGVPDNDFDSFDYSYNTNSTLMSNIAYRLGKHTFKYNVLYLNSSSQKQQEYYGIIDKDDDAAQGGGFIQRAAFERTTLLVNQFLGDIKLKDNLDLNWGVSYNSLDNVVPNRRQATILPVNSNDPDGPKSMQLISSSSDNHRFYHTLNEDEFAANIATTFKFNKNEDDEFLSNLTLGYSGRMKQINFEATQFNFRILQRDNNNNVQQQPIIQDIYNLDAYFNQQNINEGYFRIETFRGTATTPNVAVLAPQTYGGDQNIHAGFISGTHKFSPKFTAVVGLRGEKINQSIEWNTSLNSGGPSELDSFELLPMTSLKYELTEKQNLKFAASKTYTLPQYKERAPFLFQDIGGDTYGNNGLYASTDYNVDLKWELFPKLTDIISFGVFGKLIQDPINTVTVNSAANDISYVNSGDEATAFGAEFEIRKNLFESETENETDYLKTNMSVGFNLSYMNTNQNLSDGKVIEETTAAGFPLSVTFTNSEDRLSGASDLLLNADISYSKEFSKDKDISATLAYNYFSDRIYALGVQGKGNLVDQAVNTLDFIVKSTLNKNISLGLSAKNLLNPSIERIQDTQNVIVRSYKGGVDLKLSLSYRF